MSDEPKNPFIELLLLILKANTESRERAEAAGRKDEELKRYAALDETLQTLLTEVMSLLKTSGKVAVQDLKAQTRRLTDAVVRFVYDSAADYLSGRTLTSTEAAAPGELLASTLENVRASGRDILEWTTEQFQRPLLSKLLQRPYFHIGPAELYVQAVTLQVALEVARQDASRALMQFEQPHHHPLNYLMLLLEAPAPGAQAAASAQLGPAGAADPPEPPAKAGLTIQPKPKAPIKAPLADMQSASALLRDLTGRIIRMVEDLLAKLKKASRPGGGIDPHAVRQVGAATLQLCTFFLHDLGKQMDDITHLDGTTVDSKPA